MKRIIAAAILLIGSIANSAYKEISLRNSDADMIDSLFERIGDHRSFTTSPDGSTAATRVTYGDEGGKIVCDARGVMNAMVICKISVNTGYKPGSKSHEQKVKVDDSVAGELSIVIFHPDDVKQVAQALGASEFVSSAKAPNGNPLVRVKCKPAECRLTFAN